MATLIWVRDKYDADLDRRINKSEHDKAFADWTAGRIGISDFSSVADAYSSQTLLPTYDGEISPMSISNTISIIISTGAMLKVDGVEVI